MIGRLLLSLVFALLATASLPASAEQVQLNKTHRLQHTDGSYFGKSYSGKSYYYPIPRGGSGEAELLLFSGNGGPLRHGQQLKLKATNTSGWKASWRKSNLLGTFSDGVYYWDDAGDKSVWIAEKIGGTGVIEAGDFFRLRNKSWNQYLVVDDGKLNTTSQKTDASWRVPPTVDASKTTKPPNIDGRLKIATFNTYLMQVDNAPDRPGRARLIGTADFLRRYDVVVLNELFDDGPSRTLMSLLHGSFPHQTPIVGQSRNDAWAETLGDFSDAITVIRGGIAIVSKWPIEYQVQRIFSEAGGWDYNANKGFAYARIRYMGDRIHVIATHTNAAGGGGLAGISSAKPGYAAGWQERQSQFREIAQFIETRGIPANELVVIAGDLNVIRGSREYTEMLALLNASAPRYEGLPATWDPSANALIKDKSAGAEWLDYVLLHSNHNPPGVWINRAFKPNGNLSDHFPVEAVLRPQP